MDILPFLGLGGGGFPGPAVDPFSAMQPGGVPPWMTPELALGFAQNPDATGQRLARAGYPPPVPPVPSLGTSLTPPAPREGTPQAAGLSYSGEQGTPTPVTGATMPSQGLPTDGSQPKGMSERLLGALKGLKQPEVPKPALPTSPAAPRPATAIKGGDLMALMAALGQGGGGASGLRLPATLGQALGGR